jgi:hypothetical protein
MIRDQARRVLALLTMLAVLSLGLPPAAQPVAAQSTGNVECLCPLTGPYREPAAGKPIAANREGFSPHIIYQANATPTGSTVNVRIERGGALVKEVSGLPQTASWGFSPDDHRFVYHYPSGTGPNQVHNVYLLDLEAVGVPLVKELHQATSDARIAFSPNGHSLLYAALTAPNFTSLILFDAVEGDTRYETGFQFESPPGTSGDRFGLTQWGFGPDQGDRTFVYVYVSGQTSAAWNVVNLTRPAGTALVLSETSVASGFWQFSPCGDLLGVVRQPNQDDVTVRLNRTLDGSVVNLSERTFPDASVELRATATEHIAKVGAVDRVLAPNTANGACPTAPALSQLSLSPTTVQGVGKSTGTVRLSDPAPIGGVTVNLSSNPARVATVPPSVTIHAGNTSATFKVQAQDVTTQGTATISAVAGGVTKTATLTVTPRPARP